MVLLGVLSVPVVPQLIGLAAGLLFLLAFEVGALRLRKAGAPSRHLGSPSLVRIAVIVWLAAFVWPVWNLARSYTVGVALQEGLFALAVPVLVVLGAPWGALAAVVGKRPPEVRRVRPSLRSVERAPTGFKIDLGRDRPGMGTGLGGGSRGTWKAWLALGFFVASYACWRTPFAVDGLHRISALVLLEAAWLCVAGVLLWMELVGSGVFSPRCDRPARMGIAAVAMWSVWIMGFVLGFSHTPWYRAYLRSGDALSGMIDQEMTAGLLFLTGVAAFVPLIFSTLIRWLRSQDDTDDALYEALREEASRIAEERDRDNGGPHRLAGGSG
ncbi:MAG: cytochrome c oxidase assembly protein [Actinomycetota bacterium]|nr:cytochrome c oxidase assembly protein [Actinomycetota bacterium]